MWIRRYNKEDYLTQSVELGDLGETKSYYSIHNREYVRMNVWDDLTILEYKQSDEDIELLENRDGSRFFRCISKNNKKGGINYPNYIKHFSIENGEVQNFTIDKNKIKSWKTKAKKKSLCQN